MKTVGIFWAVLLFSACQSEDNSVDAGALLALEQRALIIDVRTPEEYEQGHYPGAINIPHEQILAGVRSRALGPDDPIVLYCRSGNRSGKAQTTLRDAGYSVTHNAGGLSALLAATGQDPVRSPEP
ncbi:MAG: rhodanese-like domain-containing protein [Gammaproteobacteria bacterium]|jgi:phage shock protein E|nr:rhodanese-like domain-containing protein [Gammaproteobacteria bacterium]